MDVARAVRERRAGGSVEAFTFRARVLYGLANAIATPGLGTVAATVTVHCAQPFTRRKCWTPMADSSLTFTSACELAAMIRRREVSPVEVTDHFLRRIERLNPKLNAFLAVAGTQAVSAARAAEQALVGGAPLAPLHGVPVAVKDLEFTEGLRSTGGSLVYRDLVPDEDSVMVGRLKRAGAIVLGKTNTPEFGSHSEAWNRLGDDCRNPWDSSLTSGGSSGGSAAAVAAGLAPLATGSDGAGSIRVPASFCGVYGLKPTFGSVPQHGGYLGIPLFGVSGPVARTVRDAALWLDVTAGYDARDPNSSRREPPGFLDGLGQSVDGLRVAWSADLDLVATAPEVHAATESAARTFESLGCRVEAAAPVIEHDYFLLSEPIRNADKHAAFGDLLESHAGALTPYIRSILELGAGVTGRQYSQCLRYLERLRARMADFFERYDLLLTPTTPFPAFPVRQPPHQRVRDRDLPDDASSILLTLVWNLTGQPAANVPCGVTSAGLPVGLQIIGGHGEDLTVLRASAAFEQHRPWAGRVPPVAG